MTADQPSTKKCRASKLRIAVGGISHETNTFSTACMGLTEVPDFYQGGEVGTGPLKGDSIIHAFEGTRTYLGGFIDAAKELGIELVPLLMAEAEPSGTISDKAYEVMSNELIQRLKEVKNSSIDAVGLVLHGAGVSESLEDIELDIGRKVRNVIGPDKPLVSAWDLHGNISEECAAVFDIMCNIHTYPHIDAYERGWDAIQYVPKILANTIKPARHLERVPTLLPLSKMCTMEGHPASELKSICEDIAKSRPKVLECTVFHGFPHANVSIVGTSVYCATDGDAQLAESVAKEVAAWIWANREKFRLQPIGAKEAVQKALAHQGSPIVLNETSDNTGCGTPGDATHLLKAFIEAKLPRDMACFGPFWDAAVVQQAHAAGVGASIVVSLGGKHDPDLNGLPICGVALVRCLSDGIFRWSGPMETGLVRRLGKSTLLSIANVDVVVSSERVQPYDSEPFKLHGIDISKYKLVGLKSSIHFRAGFGHLAAAIVTADEPGLSSGRHDIFEAMRTKPHLPKQPMWPAAEDMATYTP